MPQKITLQTIASYREEGKDAAQIAQILNDDPRQMRDGYTTSPSPQDVDLLELLTDTYTVLKRDKSGVWNGPLVDYIEQPGIPQELVDGFDILLTHLSVSNRPLPANSKAHIGALTTTITGIVGTIIEARVGDDRTSADVAASVALLTGGKLYSTSTEVVQSLIYH